MIARAASGDRTAFAQLMEHYQSACYGLAWRLLHDPDQAADATQDAFIHAYRAIGSYRGGIFRSWLLRITANASYDILRRAQRRPSSPLPDPDEGAPELPDLGAINPLAEATKSEMYRHLEVALRLLPQDQRTAVVLCDVYGMDYNEVAAMTQLRARHGEVADPPRPAAAARAAGRAPGTLHRMRASGPMAC